MGKDEETEELIKIFVTSIKTAEKRPKIKQVTLNCGAQRYHYSMFNVGRSMFDVHL
jgi:hypothetical protein